MKVDVAIIGGGAAGLFCALTAGQRGRKVMVVEHRERVGLKIAISGGGRCNFTNIYAEPENYISGNPSFCRSALARFSPWDIIAMVEKHGIAYHEKKLGQQFCNTSSRQITTMLLDECAAAGVEIRCGCQITHVEKPDVYRLKTSQGEIEADSLVVATGGLSFPNLGATDFGYRIAKQFGLHITELRPGLVPLTFGPSEKAAFADLSGVSIPITAQLGLMSFSEAALFTHRGLSGPAILQISSFWRAGSELSIDLLPGIRNVIPASGPKTSLPALLGAHWPRRLADVWSTRHAPARPLTQWSAREREDVSRHLHAWKIPFSGTEGYPKAEVTVGGVDTSELSSKTMEARHVPGLYFIGEVVDVTGWLGGYNFQWAWASGHAAGSVV